MTLLLGYAIKSSLVLLAALAGVRLLGGRSAAFRHALLATAVIAAGAVPLMTALLPARTISLPAPLPVLSTVPAAGTHAVEESAEQYYEVDAFPPTAPATVQTREVVTPRSLNPAQFFFWLWMAGVGILLADLIAGVVQLVRISRRSRILNEGPWVQLAAETARRYGLSPRLRVLETSGQAVLATWGVFRPQLLLPSGASTWTEERIRVVLHHELGHVCRYDWLIQMAAEIFRAVYWFNPLSWIACEALVQESEQACDDIALNCGIAGPDYARQLLALTVALQHPAPDVSAAMSMARPSTLERRFAALLNPRENRSAMTRVSMLLVMAIVLALAGPVASLRLVAETMTMILPAPLVAAIPVPALESAPVLQGLPPAAVPIPAGATSIPSGAASIEGTVVKFGTGESIAAADVSLQMLPGPGATQMAPPTVIQTGADGKFAFRNLAAGNYRLVALRAEGFVVAEYGQRTPNGRGRPLLVAEGQRVSAVNLAMMPTGSISGRILDRDGEPLARAQVQALQLMYRDGRKVVKIIQSVQTNDVGEYRLFWLPPDAYYISARPEDTRRRAVPFYVNLPGTGGFFEQAASPVVTHRALDNGGTAEESFVLVYYPGTIDFTTASRVDLRAGDSLGGVNFSVGAGQVRSSHVKGRAIDTNGQPLSGTITAIPRTPHPNVTIPSATLDASGRFDIAGVAPGAYYVVAGNPLGIAAVEVSGSDIENLVITSKPGVDLNGRIAIDGKPSLENDPDLVRLQGPCGPAAGAARCLPVRFNFVAEPALMGFPQEAPGGMPQAGGAAPNSVLADGTFTLRNLAVRDYRLAVTGLPPDWYIKSARLGSVDPFATLVSIATMPTEQLEVVIGMNGGRLEGKVVNATGQPVPSASVALIPELSKRSLRHLYRNAVTDETGVFRFQAIAPGDYKVFAWEEIELSSWLDPEVVRPYENRGKAIRINDGGRESIEAVAIPAQR